MDNIVSQQIPHDSDAEKAVLGAIFIDPEAIADASAVVQPEDFYERANQIISRQCWTCLIVGMQLIH